MIYDLKNVFHENVNKANEAIKYSNDLSNELTKQLIAVTTFFLMFISSFSFVLENLLRGKIRFLIIFALIFSVFSIICGLASIFVASDFFIKKAKENYKQAVETQDYINKHNAFESDSLPYKYDIRKGPEVSKTELILNWGQMLFFVLSIILIVSTIIYLLIKL